MQKEWYQDLNEYIRLGEPNLEEKTVAWQTAIGLQAVDGLSTSAYLLETAKDNIEGKITISEANARINSYYEELGDRKAIERGTKEADIVAGRITALLGEKPLLFRLLIGFLYTDIFLQIYLLMLEKSEPIISVKTNGFCEEKVFFTRLTIVFQ